MNQKGFAPLLFIGIIILISIGIIGTSLLAKRILVKPSQVRPSPALTPEPTFSQSPVASPFPITQTNPAPTPAAEKFTKVIQLVNLSVTVKCNSDQEKTLLEVDSNYGKSADALEKCTRTLSAQGKTCADLCGLQTVGAQAECLTPVETLTPEQLTTEVTTQQLQCNQKAINGYNQCLAKCEGFVGTCPSLSSDPSYDNLRSLIAQNCK